MRIRKDEYYLELARVASLRSTCLRRHYGAVIVKDDRVIATGYNGAPRGCDNCCDKGYCARSEVAHGTQYELCRAIHAEANAILQGTASDMIGATLYLYGEDVNGLVVSAEPCLMCKRLILNAGIKAVFCRVSGIEVCVLYPDDWRDFL